MDFIKYRVTYRIKIDVDSFEEKEIIHTDTIELSVENSRRGWRAAINKALSAPSYMEVIRIEVID